jgi:hypothetical protein
VNIELTPVMLDAAVRRVVEERLDQRDESLHEILRSVAAELIKAKVETILDKVVEEEVRRLCREGIPIRWRDGTGQMQNGTETLVQIIKGKFSVVPSFGGDSYALTVLARVAAEEITREGSAVGDALRHAVWEVTPDVLFEKAVATLKAEQAKCEAARAAKRGTRDPR